MSEETATTEKRMIGRVKWFNNKAGYGFITISENNLTDKDIFVHYSNINVVNPQYKYLVQGEYVEFLLEKMENEKHQFKAIQVTGINGGSIMCETRRLSRGEEDGLSSQRIPRERRERPEQKQPSEVKHEETDGFTTIVKKRVSKRTTSKKE